MTARNAVVAGRGSVHPVDPEGLSLVRLADAELCEFAVAHRNAKYLRSQATFFPGHAMPALLAAPHG